MTWKELTAEAARVHRLQKSVREQWVVGLLWRLDWQACWLFYVLETT